MIYHTKYFFTCIFPKVIFYMGKCIYDPIKKEKSMYHITQHIRHVEYNVGVMMEPLCTLADQNW